MKPGSNEPMTAVTAISAGLIPAPSQLSESDLELHRDLARGSGCVLVPVRNITKYANDPDGPSLVILQDRILELLDEYNPGQGVAMLAASMDGEYFCLYLNDSGRPTDEFMTWVYRDGEWFIEWLPQYEA